MYLTEPRLFDIVKKQVNYKLNAYTGVFSSLMIIQIIGILFGFGAIGSSGFGMNDTLDVSKENFSNDVPVVFTMFWAFITGVLVTTKAYRNDIFSLVANRLSHHLSSFLFLLISACIAGVTMVLSGSIIQLSAQFKVDSILIASTSIIQNPVEFLAMIATAILYTILFMSVGYIVGSVAQKSMALVVLIVVALFVAPILQLDLNIGTFIGEVAKFFGEETSLLIFSLKILAAAAFLFAASIGVTNKLEVKK